jgi:hypothetical protein
MSFMAEYSIIVRPFLNKNKIPYVHAAARPYVATVCTSIMRQHKKRTLFKKYLQGIHKRMVRI